MSSVAETSVSVFPDYQTTINRLRADKPSASHLDDSALRLVALLFGDMTLQSFREKNETPFQVLSGFYKEADAKWMCRSLSLLLRDVPTKLDQKTSQLFYNQSHCTGSDITMNPRDSMVNPLTMGWGLTGVIPPNPDPTPDDVLNEVMKLMSATSHLDEAIKKELQQLRQKIFDDVKAKIQQNYHG